MSKLCSLDTFRVCPPNPSLFLEVGQYITRCLTQAFFKSIVSLCLLRMRYCLLLTGKMRRLRRRRRRHRQHGDGKSSSWESDFDSLSDLSEEDSDLEEEWDEERDWLGQLTPGGTTRTGTKSSLLLPPHKTTRCKKKLFMNIYCIYRNLGNLRK